MECWGDRVVIPMRRVWINVTTRIGIRRTGLWKLRKEVRTCEYEDVHVMWEMLRKTDSEIGLYPPVAMGGDNKMRRAEDETSPEGEGEERHVGGRARVGPYNLCRDF